LWTILCGPTFAQTAATSTLTGTVSDSSGAVIPGAAVALHERGSDRVVQTETNEAGLYVLAAVRPGSYRLEVSKPGLQTIVVPDLTLNVAKSLIVNLTLLVKETSETIEVKAGAAVDLQTLDSTVGAVIQGETLTRLPNINRSAMAFFSLQPLVTPTRGTGIHASGQVAGARSDQTTFNLDGVDATDFTAGTNQYVSSAIDFSGPMPMIPVPAESVEEFRVSTTNPNATFGRSAGGQVSLVTRRGGNQWHGSGYLYHQNDNLNANRWDFNRLGISRPELKDNRFGGSIGGALRRDRTFLFANYEGRRLPQAVGITRLVPTESLRQGVLRFRDQAGSVRSYSVRELDPRGVGVSPVIGRLWNLLPAGNDATLGDGLNTTGFRAPVDASLQMDFGVLRLDHTFNEKWRANAVYRYSTQSVRNTNQVDIAGLTPGAVRGEAVSVGRTPVQPRFFSLQFTGTLTSRMVNEINLGYARNWWAYERAVPFPQVPGTAASLIVAQGLVDQGIDNTAGVARARVWRDQLYQLQDNFSWLAGKHQIQAGLAFRHLPVFHDRNDKVVGSLTQLSYQLNARTAVGIPASMRPPTCSATATANCLRSTDVAAFNDLFAGALGLVDQANVTATRDGSLQPLPFGTPLQLNTRYQAWEFYFNDAWRVRPDLTITLGLNYSIQPAPREVNGRYTRLVDAATGESLGADQILGRRRDSALRGDVYNPTLGWRSLPGDGDRIFNTDYNNLGPRIAVSWQPRSRWLGGGKTVYRGGYSLVFDRVNGGTGVFWPALNAAFAQSLNCQGPRRDGRCAVGSDPITGFRVGVDGDTVTLPALAPPTAPVVLPNGLTEAISFAVDPNLRLGQAHSINFTVQRELPGNLLVEVGYAGRLSRNLQQNVQLNSVPYMMIDRESGQAFAEAFDNVARHLRGGGSAASAPAQPWFENQLRGSSLCSPRCTVGLASQRAAAFQQGLLNNLFSLIDAQRPTGPILNQQAFDLWMRTDGGLSNYHAGFVSVSRRLAKGFTVSANYTRSKATDFQSANQESESLLSTGFNYQVDYARANFDRTHVFNSNFFYEIPGNSRFRRLSQGWYVSGIIAASSGLPLTVVQSNSAWGGSAQITALASGAVPVRPVSGSSVNSGIAGSGGVGVSGSPANRGSGLNLFADPEYAFGSFRPIEISRDGRHGRNALTGLRRFNTDLSVGKKTSIGEGITAVFTADFINLPNRVEFADPALNLNNRAAFGVLSTQFNVPRAIQLGLRLEF
jgi:hypothetical protein